MGDVIQRLTTMAEDMFDCTHGPAMAFFEMPQRGADPIRVVYVTYVVSGDDIDDLEQWMLSVLMSLEDKGGTRLFWRLETRFSVEVYDERYYLRTRLAVLDDDLNAVVIKDAIKPEGGESARV